MPPVSGTGVASLGSTADGSEAFVVSTGDLTGENDDGRAQVFRIDLPVVLVGVAEQESAERVLQIARGLIAVVAVEG